LPLIQRPPAEKRGIGELYFVAQKSRRQTGDRYRDRYKEKVHV
jgi:hypothetical protein